MKPTSLKGQPALWVYENWFLKFMKKTSPITKELWKYNYFAKKKETQSKKLWVHKIIMLFKIFLLKKILKKGNHAKNLLYNL